MSVNCDVIVFFLIYGQFVAIWKPDSGRMVQLRFSLTITFCLAKPESRNKKFLIQLSYYSIVLSKGIIFTKKAIF